MSDLAQAHNRGEHDCRPVFGCAECIAALACWVCRCGDTRLPASTYCPVCRRRRPKSGRHVLTPRDDVYTLSLWSPG